MMKLRKYSKNGAGVTVERLTIVLPLLYNTSIYVLVGGDGSELELSFKY